MPPSIVSHCPFIIAFYTFIVPGLAANFYQRSRYSRIDDVVYHFLQTLPMERFPGRKE